MSRYPKGHPNGWNKWEGGDAPTDKRVRVVFRDLSLATDEAGSFDWLHHGDDLDILAWIDADLLPADGNHDAGGEGKMTNPKDVIGSAKLDLGLVPDSMVVYAAMAFTEGAVKYGRYNWRIAGVRTSIYFAAMLRHMFKWWNGEECDPKTKVPHLASALACIAIIIDAKLVDKLTDDRPPRSGIAKAIEQAEAVVTGLKELFKDHKPRHFTIADEA